MAAPWLSFPEISQPAEAARIKSIKIYLFFFTTYHTILAITKNMFEIGLAALLAAIFLGNLTMALPWPVAILALRAVYENIQNRGYRGYDIRK